MKEIIKKVYHKNFKRLSVRYNIHKYQDIAVMK